LHSLADMRLTKIAYYLIFVGAAVIAADLLANFAHNELGLSRYAIREAALVCSGVLGIGLYSHRLGKRK
jgi:hypothetical protein